jgi:hypothetical protein
MLKNKALRNRPDIPDGEKRRCPLLKKTSGKMVLFVWTVVIIFLTGCGNDSTDKQDNPYDKPHNPNKGIVVNAVSPVSGGIGTKVIVTGSNFGNDATKVKLLFNEKEALIMNIQDNAIYALVPKQPGDFSTVKVLVNDKEGVLDGMQFQYFIKSAVTTVAGQVGVNDPLADGPALQAVFARPVMVAASDDGLVFISDDKGGRIRLFSTKDNVITTVIDGLTQPWTMDFSADQSKLFVVEREEKNRPILFYTLYKNTNWMQRDIFYDQKNEQGVYIAGGMPYACLTADETYVYMLSRSGAKLIRVNQETKKVEQISDDLVIQSTWLYIAFNPIDRKIYCVSEQQGRLYRFDPYYTPPGKDTPWLTLNNVEHLAGSYVGSAQEGNGVSMRMGSLSGIDIDDDGYVYLPDYSNHVIWKFDALMNGTIICGTPGKAGYKDGDPQEALMNRPYDISSTKDGLMYVADVFNYVIRCIAIQ